MTLLYYKKNLYVNIFFIKFSCAARMRRIFVVAIAERGRGSPTAVFRSPSRPPAAQRK